MVSKIKEIAYKYAFILIIIACIVPFCIKVEPYEFKKEVEVFAPTVIYKYEPVREKEPEVVEEEFDLHQSIINLIFNSDFRLHNVRETDSSIILELYTKDKSLDSFDKELTDNIATIINREVKKECIVMITSENDVEKVLYTTRISCN